MKNLILFVSLAFSASCNTRRFDLENMTFQENVRVFLKGKKKIFEPREVLTTLPASQTYEVRFFKYGPVAFREEDEDEKRVRSYSSVYFLLEDTVSAKIKGFYIIMNSQSESKQMYRYLEEKYGKPLVIRPDPQINKEGRRLGWSAFLWKNTKPDRSIVFSNTFMEKNKKPAVESSMVIIDNAIRDRDPGANRTVLERIIKTFE